VTNEEAEAFVDSLWLTGCHPTPVEQTALLAALLDQNGHYVSDKVVGLMALAGVAPSGGYALVMRTDTWGSAMEPPGGTIRTNGEFDALFYPEHGLPTYEESVAALPDVLVPCRAACERWGIDSAYEENKLNFPWGSSSVKSLDPQVLRRTGQCGDMDAAAHHAWLFARGRPAGVVAVAAGRLSAVVLAVIPARWMFDVETP